MKCAENEKGMGICSVKLCHAALDQYFFHQHCHNVVLVSWIFGDVIWGVCGIFKFSMLFFHENCRVLPQFVLNLVLLEKFQSKNRVMLNKYVNIHHYFPSKDVFFYFWNLLDSTTLNEKKGEINKLLPFFISSRFLSKWNGRIRSLIY